MLMHSEILALTLQHAAAPRPRPHRSPACFSIPCHFLFLLNYPRPSLCRLQRAFTDDALNPDLCPLPHPQLSYSVSFRTASESDGVAAAISFAGTPRKRVLKMYCLCGGEPAKRDRGGSHSFTVFFGCSLFMGSTVSVYGFDLRSRRCRRMCIEVWFCGNCTGFCSIDSDVIHLG